MDSVRAEVRTSVEEMKRLAVEVAKKLNQRKSKNLVKFMIPLKGFSFPGSEGGTLYDPDSDKAFIETIKECLDPEIEIIKVDNDINSPEFAEEVVQILSRTLH
jgi:uncharacterized protein (UPF0261 family)